MPEHIDVAVALHSGKLVGVAGNHGFALSSLSAARREGKGPTGASSFEDCQYQPATSGSPVLTWFLLSHSRNC